MPETTITLKAGIGDKVRVAVSKKTHTVTAVAINQNGTMYHLNGLGWIYEGAIKPIKGKAK